MGRRRVAFSDVLAGGPRAALAARRAPGGRGGPAPGPAAGDGGGVVRGHPFVGPGGRHRGQCRPGPRRPLCSARGGHDAGCWPSCRWRAPWRRRGPGACTPTPPTSGPEPAERTSQLYLSRTLDGRREVSGHLGAEDAAVVEAAVAAAEGPATRPTARGQRPSAAQRRAEALAEVCRWFLTHDDKAPAGARHRPQVSVIVGLADLAQGRPGRLADGTAVPASAVSCLACDAVLHRIVMAGRSTVLDYGSSVRTVSSAAVGGPGRTRRPLSSPGLRPPTGLVRSPPRTAFLPRWPDLSFQLGDGLQPPSSSLARPRLAARAQPRRHPGRQIPHGEGHHEPATAGACSGLRTIVGNSAP